MTIVKLFRKYFELNRSEICTVISLSFISIFADFDFKDAIIFFSKYLMELLFLLLDSRCLLKSMNQQQVHSVCNGFTVILHYHQCSSQKL